MMRSGSTSGSFVFNELLLPMMGERLLRSGGLWRILLGWLLGRSLGANAENAGLSGWRRSLGLAIVDWGQVGSGWIGTGVVRDGRRGWSAVAAGDGSRS